MKKGKWAGKCPPVVAPLCHVFCCLSALQGRGWGMQEIAVSYWLGVIRSDMLFTWLEILKKVVERVYTQHFSTSGWACRGRFYAVGDVYVCSSFLAKLLEQMTSYHIH